MQLDWNIKIKPSCDLIDLLLAIEKEEKSFPQNIMKIFICLQILDKTKLKTNTIKADSSSIDFTDEELKILNEITVTPSDDENQFETKSADDNISSEDHKVEFSKTTKKYLKLVIENNLYLELNDIKWLYGILKKNRELGNDSKYLHEILATCEVVLPEIEQVERDPVLEARCQKLRAEQENRDYRKMTKNVDSSRQKMPEDTISYQVKAINKQLIAILQFVFSVAAGFAFGFIGVQLIVGNLDFGFRLLLGIICALIIALAEIYFLAKKLNELNEIPDDNASTMKLHKD